MEKEAKQSMMLYSADLVMFFFNCAQKKLFWGGVRARPGILYPGGERGLAGQFFGRFRARPSVLYRGGEPGLARTPADARALSVERVRLVRDGCASVREFVGFMIRVCPRGPNAIGESLKFVAQGLGASFPWSGCMWCGMGLRV